MTFWHCRSERAQAQRAALDAEQRITGGVPPEQVCVLVRDVATEGPLIGTALEERGIPFRLAGAAAYFQRSEVRDVIAWLRLLADPGDSGAVVRALSRPPIELRQVDIARLTQLARRRKLDMVSGIEAACEAPGLSPEGRDRALAFLRVYRAASRAFEEMSPDRFVHRLIERIGLRRQQVFAAKADTVERLVNIAKLADLAADFVRREPGSSSRDFARYLAAVAEAGLPEEEAAAAGASAAAVQVMSMHDAKGTEFDTVVVLGLSAAKLPGARREGAARIPTELLKESLPECDPREEHEAAMRRLAHVAMSRARRRLVLSWAEGERGPGARPSPFFEEARAALEAEVEVVGRGAVRPGRGAALDLPDDARRAARQRGAGRRPPRRDAARHLPRGVALGGPLPGAPEDRRADRARQGRPERARRPRRGERAAAPGREPRAGASCSGSPRSTTTYSTPRATSADAATRSCPRPTTRSSRSSRAAARA